jgi:hypothetical protein
MLATKMPQWEITLGFRQPARHAICPIGWEPQILNINLRDQSLQPRIARAATRLTIG